MSMVLPADLRLQLLTQALWTRQSTGLDGMPAGEVTGEPDNSDKEQTNKPKAHQLGGVRVSSALAP